MVKKTGKMYVFKIKTDVENVKIKGSWNNWKEEEMKLSKDGYFTKRKKLSPGIYEFGYLVDGEWIIDDNCEHISSPFGGKNSVLEVK